MRLLIIGTLHGQVGAASKIARDRGARIVQASDIESAMESLRSGNGADLILMHVKDDIAGIVACLKSERINVPVVGCGFESSTEDAVRAIKSGAKEYLPLPPDPQLIAAVLEAISEEDHSLIFTSDAMRQVVSVAEQIAPSDAGVLITGESGTGKEVFAHFIHSHSKRKNNPLVCVNCAAIPENLMESELFGHEKGAFTGAVARRLGKFEEANGGTLFLDEISEMALHLQAKLLRAIQEKVIDRVGGNTPVKVNIRILASSNRNLREYVNEGKFREDLFFRLNVINIHLPPLRERREDIAHLAEYFIKKYSEANGVPVKPLSDEAMTRIINYSWPGNVRELENSMHRAVLLSTDYEIKPDAIMLTSAMAQPATQQTVSAQTRTETSSKDISGFVGRTVESMERDLILHTLDHCLGNRTHAANILGISIRTLRNKLRQYNDEGIAVPAARDGSK